MSQQAAQAEAQAKADQLHAAARGHKRAAQQHRRRARAAMAQLEQLRAECARIGIRIDINVTKPEGGHGARPEDRSGG